MKKYHQLSYEERLKIAELRRRQNKPVILEIDSVFALMYALSKGKMISF
jgi:hypothetical protein